MPATHPQTPPTLTEYADLLRALRLGARALGLDSGSGLWRGGCGR